MPIHLGSTRSRPERGAGMTRTAYARRATILGSAAALLLSALVVAPTAGAHPGAHSDEPPPGIGVLLAPGTPEEQFLPGFQYSGTPAVDGRQAPFEFVGNGCTPASYAGADVAGKIALADRGAPGVCPPTTFFQRVAYAEQAGAIGLVTIAPEDRGPTTNGTAITGGIPGLEVFRTPEILAARDAAIAGEEPVAALVDTREPIPSMGPTPCEGGKAGPFECENIDLLSFTSHTEFDSAGISDIWGWTDPADGGEYVMMGKTNGTAFFNITDPTAPLYLGEIPNPSPDQQVWHDIKVYKDHAFIVSESETHGMVVFDLTRLRGLGASDGTVRFTPDATYELTSAAHNLEINTATGYAYIVGGNAGIVAPDQCLSGLHMVNIQNPKNPVFAGCYSAEGGPGTAARVVGGPVQENSPAAYVHDTTCVIYDGPDTEHHGKEICFNSAEDKVVIADVTNKLAPKTLGFTSYENIAYAHQGSLTADKAFLLVNDELDELRVEEVETTRTMVLDVRDLDAPTLHFVHEHETTAIDHNNYVHEGFVYQSNYSAGLRVLDVANVPDRSMTEVAFFDTYPSHTNPTFDGTWSNYPFFESGTVAVSGRQEGLFLVKVRDEVLNPAPSSEPLSITCTDCPLEIRAGESGTARFDVTGAGESPEVTVADVPAGWTATVDGVRVTVEVPVRERAGTSTLTVTVTRDGESASAPLPVEVVKGRPSDKGPRG
jgi:choice-of-anchor B domain-containing protein